MFSGIFAVNASAIRYCNGGYLYVSARIISLAERFNFEVIPSVSGVWVPGKSHDIVKKTNVHQNKVIKSNDIVRLIFFIFSLSMYELF